MNETLAALVKQLSAANMDERLHAAEALLEMGEEAQAAAPALVRACADDAEEVRELAAGTLESLGPPASGDVTALAELLEAGHGDIAYWAATLLGRIGAEAAAAIPALVKTLAKEDSPSARERAAWALGQIGVAKKDAIDALQKAAEHASPRLARLAQEALDSFRS